MHTTGIVRDNNLRSIQVTYSGSGPRTLNRNLLGQITNTVDASGLNVILWYNNQGLLAKATTTNGTLFQAVYDVYDRPITNITAEGVVVTNSFDALGRLLTRGYANTGFEQFVYSTNGLATYYDPQGHATQFGYDTAGRLTSVTNANQEGVTFAYDPAGDVIAVTNALGKSTTWAYDMYGRMIAETNANGVLILTNGYDYNGSVTARWTKAKGLSTFVYDPNGSLASATYPGMSLSYAYDDLNRLRTVNDALGSTTFTYANFGAFSSALATESGPWTSDTRTYSYANAVLQGLTLTQPSGNWTESFVPDGQLRLQNLTTPDGTYTNTYYGAGRLIQRIGLPGGCYITNSFDNDGMLLDTWLKNSTGSILNHHGYPYDLSFNRTNATRADSSHLTYAYDAIGQLLKATGYDTTGTGAPRLNEAFGYGYDEADNLNFRTNGVLTETFTADSLNQLSTSRTQRFINRRGDAQHVPASHQPFDQWRGRRGLR